MVSFTLKPFQVLSYFLFFLLACSGCAPYFHQPLTTSNARLGAEAPGFQQLKQLPAPQQKVVAAVYKFRDQTGQYKPTATGSSFSTAVTQGATSILLRALEESGWFTAIERENLGNLLNERKIIRSSRAEYSQNSGRPEPPMPPLLFAGIVLEGGIISYDANMMTGGAGMRYFGAGASGQYREDRVTIYLRAISTNNGRILKTVYTSKTILSQQVDVGVFRFVKLKRLLEAETGFTYNEPSEMAVKEAIEKAVESLVIEGVIDGLWSFNNTNQNTGGVNDSISPANSQKLINQEIIQRYLQEKEENSRTDELGRYLVDRRSRFGISLKAGGVQYAGDYSNPQIRPTGELALQLNSRSFFSGFFKGGTGQLEARDSYSANYYYAEAGGIYRVFPRDKYTPFLTGSAGVLAAEKTGPTDLNYFPSVGGGIGVEYLVHKRIGLSLSLHNHYLFSDNLDGVEQGRYNDYLWSGKIGATFYLGNLFNKPSNSVSP